ncbi:hypothetical protein FGB62_68g042 [Gracilaria domingensis]|nr:hypothetical protein FGB62_68g042 [Gracilaria domingensis]
MGAAAAARDATRRTHVAGDDGEAAAADGGYRAALRARARRFLRRSSSLAVSDVGAGRRVGRVRRRVWQGRAGDSDQGLSEGHCGGVARVFVLRRRQVLQVGRRGRYAHAGGQRLGDGVGGRRAAQRGQGGQGRVWRSQRGVGGGSLRGAAVDDDMRHAAGGQSGVRSYAEGRTDWLCWQAAAN